LAMLFGSLSLGFVDVAQANMKWVETINGFCPTVCQLTDYKFAVPAGIHSVTGKTFYMCAVNYARTGWRGGYNIEWKGMSDRCFAQWIRTGGRNSYAQHYLCLCTDKEMPPVTNKMLRR
jgi:hypothetical protein